MLYLNGMDQLLRDSSFPPVDMSLIPDIDRQMVENQPEKLDESFKSIEPVRKTRSRMGCFNCKKLKIKCDEIKPSCEYCQHRGTPCVYPLPKPKAVRKSRSKKQQLIDQQKKEEERKLKDVTNELDPLGVADDDSNIDFEKLSPMDFTKPRNTLIYPNSKKLQNEITTRLNSMESQLNVTNFELKLLKFFLEFGPSFFTFGVDKIAHKFWSTEVPSICVSSNLVKQAIYAVSSVRLLYFYSSDFFDGSRVENLDLFKKAVEYQEQTEKALGDLLKVTAYVDLPSDLVGQITVSKVIMIGCKGIFPKAIESDNSKVADCGLVELAHFIKNSSPEWSTSVAKLQGTKYSSLFSLDEGIISTPLYDFEFITHLRNYVHQHHGDLFDLTQFAYYDAISMLELGATRATIMKYPIPFFKALVKISKDDDFFNLLKKNDHTAMKIMFHLSALCSALDFRLFPGFGIWDEFVEIYKNHSFKLFNGGFEDEFDKNVHDIVVARRVLDIPYDLRLLKFIGRPLTEFLNGDIELETKNNCPPLMISER